MTLNAHKPLLYAIDAHHHYWWHGKRHHQWPAGVGNRLNQSFTPNDLIPDRVAAKVNGCVLMQSLNDYDETIEQAQHALNQEFPKNKKKLKDLSVFADAPINSIYKNETKHTTIGNNIRWLL